MQVVVTQGPADGVSQSIRNFRKQRARVFGRKRPVAPQPRSERFAGNVTHHEIGEAVDFTERMQRNDIGMIEASRRARLAPKPFPELRSARVFWRQDLDCYIAIESQFVGEINGAHAAAPQQTFDAVLKTYRFFESFTERIPGCVVRDLEAHAATRTKARFRR